MTLVKHFLTQFHCCKDNHCYKAVYTFVAKKTQLTATKFKFEHAHVHPIYCLLVSLHGYAPTVDSQSIYPFIFVTQ